MKDEEKNQFDYQIIGFSNYQIGAAGVGEEWRRNEFSVGKCPVFGRETQIRPCAAHRCRFRERGAGVCGRTYGDFGGQAEKRPTLAARRRFAGVWGCLQLFADVCSKWHGEGGPRWSGGHARMGERRSKPESFRGEIRGSVMKEGLPQRSGDRRADIAAAGPADTVGLRHNAAHFSCNLPLLFLNDKSDGTL